VISRFDRSRKKRFTTIWKEDQEEDASQRVGGWTRAGSWMNVRTGLGLEIRAQRGGGKRIALL